VRTVGCYFGKAMLLLVCFWIQ